MRLKLLFLLLLPVMVAAQSSDTLRLDSSYTTDAIPVYGTGNFYQRDTIPVLLLVCDTSELRNKWTTQIMINEDVIYDTNRVVNVWWQFGYSVRELHNTSEGVMDAGGQICTDDMGNLIPCFHDYWKHLYYINSNKQPLPSSVIVWMSKMK